MSSVDELCALGFEQYWVKQALKLTRNNKEFALEWLLSDEFKLARQQFNEQKKKSVATEIQPDPEVEENQTVDIDSDCKEKPNAINKEIKCEQCQLLQQQIEQLQQQKQRLQEEAKEREIEFERVKQELIEWKKSHPNNYLQWTPDEVVDWMMNLDGGAYKEYEQALRKAMKEDNVNGAALEVVSEIDFRAYGVKDVKQRKRLFQRLQQLLGNNQQNAAPAAADADNEGGLETEYH